MRKTLAVQEKDLSMDSLHPHKSWAWRLTFGTPVVAVGWG